MKLILAILFFPLLYIVILLIDIVQYIYLYVIEIINAILGLNILGLLLLIVAFPILFLMEILQCIYKGFIASAALCSAFIYGEKTDSDEFQTFYEQSPETNDYEDMNLDVSGENERTL